MEQDVSVKEATIRGVGGFEATLAPKLQALAKGIEKIGKLKKIGSQASLMNLGELRKQLDDVRRMSKDLDQMADTIEQGLDSYAIAPSTTEQLEWWERFRRSFHAGYPPLDGEYPVFQVFPVEIRVDLEHELVLVNNRTVRTIHPEAVASMVEKEIDRLNRERFNASGFAKALLRAYDLLMAEAKQKAEGHSISPGVPLKTLHQVLSMRSGASSYTLNQFAFDIYRLRRSESIVTDGRKLQFGSSRNRGGIVITMPGGHQEYFGSLEVGEASE